MVKALHQSLVSAFILFGWPGQDRRNSCMSAEKWEPTASFIVLFLGYLINSRTMVVTWPLYKRQALLLDIQKALANPRRAPVQTVASIMGKVRSAADIAPWGPYVSLSLADALKQATKCAFGQLRSWWTRGKVRFSKRVIADL